VTRPDTVVVERFDIANASFWLDMVACWLGDPAHARQLAVDLWDDTLDADVPLTVIIGRAAAALRVTLNADADADQGVRQGVGRGRVR
jgi:hypothetical protein